MRGNAQSIDGDAGAEGEGLGPPSLDLRPPLLGWRRLVNFFLGSTGGLLLLSFLSGWGLSTGPFWVMAALVAAGVAVMTFEISRSLGRIRLAQGRLEMVPRVGEPRSIDPDEIVGMVVGSSTFDLELSGGRRVRLKGLDPQEIAQVTNAVAQAAGLVLEEVKHQVSVYRRASSGVSAEAWRVRETLHCPVCRVTYPSPFWFEDPRGRPLTMCYRCYERRSQVPGIPPPEWTEDGSSADPPAVRGTRPGDELAG